MKPPSLPRHNHPLQPRLPVIAPRPLVKDRDTKTRSTDGNGCTATEIANRFVQPLYAQIGWYASPTESGRKRSKWAKKHC
jgi:hypothetical protein